MAKTKKKPAKGQQDLIDIQPENAKAIIAAAKRYREFQGTRLTALKGEVEQKRKVLALVKEAKLQRLADGKIKFNYDGFTVSVTPQEDLVQIKEETIRPPKK